MPDTSDVPVPLASIPTEAIVAAREAFESYEGLSAPMAIALMTALQVMGFRQEWAVPCLDKENCRTLAKSREHAEELARSEGGVIESRISQPWRPVV